MLLIFFVSCSNNGTNEQYNEVSDLSELTAGFGDRRLYAFAILEDSVLFAGSDHSPNSEPNNRIYYRYFFDTSTFVQIGTFSNFYMSTGDYTLIDNMVYFDSTLYTDNNELYNAIFMIDLDQNTLTRLNEDMQSIEIFHLMSYKGDLISLKRRVESGYEITYFETFCLNTKETEKVLESKVNMDTREGTEYLSYTVHDDMIYVMSYDSESNDEVVILVYDEHFDIYKSINLGESYEYIMGNRPHTFRIFGDFVYILNYSMRSFIGRIEEGDYLSHIHSGTLTVAPTANIRDGELLLFERHSRSTLLLDINTGNIKEDLIKFADGYNIMYIVVNEDLLFLCATPEEINFINYKYALQAR